ncbi:MAG: methyltransferase domain-containing protein [Myxococcota bacterium]|jgi:SAM-dependent methyltransferase|nr:methyltransferase domain-containing protein [Myxococcota bacterium]
MNLIQLQLRTIATALTLVLLVATTLPLPASAQLGSVKPGINDRFVDEDMDVGEWTERFEGESRQIYARRQEIVDALGIDDRERIADVGAGTGFFSELLAKKVGPNGLVWALEISPKFMEHMKERFTKAGLDNIEVSESTDKSTGLAEGSIDLAFICDVYHHFEYPQEMLRSLRYALRPRGELVIVEFERIPGETADWVLEHVRAGKEVFRAEIERAGFTLIKEVEIEGLDDNYILHFRRK